MGLFQTGCRSEMLHGTVLYKFIIGVDVIDVGGADVLYNRFNVTSSGPPVNPPLWTFSTYKCVVDTGGSYWRFSLCSEQHRVVCQG